MSVAECVDTSYVDFITAELQKHGWDAVLVEQRLELGRLRCDAPYQNDFRRKKLADMKKKFNPLCVEQILVSDRDLFWWTIDGKHRVKMLLELGYETWPGYAITGLTLRQEADLFTLLNTLKGNPKTIDVFFAGLLGSDEEAKAINRLVIDAGWQVSKTTNRAKHTRAVAALRSIHSVMRFTSIPEVLGVINECWPHDDRNGDVKIVNGVAVFLNHFSERVATATCIAKWRSTSVLEIVQQAAYHARLSDCSFPMGAARALLEIYNKGKRSNRLEWDTETE